MMERIKKNDLISYIIHNYKNKFNENISPIKLQKSLYFLFAFWGGNIRKAKNSGNAQTEIDFNNFDEFLFNDANFQAWTYGPVDSDVYRNYKYDNNQYDFKQENVSYWDSIQKEFIDYYLDRVFITNDFALVDLSHEDNAWKEAFNTSSKIIDNEKIIAEYASR